MSIKVKDLMIGNYIFDPFDNVVQVAELKKNEIGLTNRNGGTENSFEPIPLSAELLEKCGFKKSEGGYYDIILHGNLYLMITFYESKIAIGVRNSAGYINLNDYKLLHLHQIQNIVHALTNSELEINL